MTFCWFIGLLLPNTVRQLVPEMVANDLRLPMPHFNLCEWCGKGGIGKCVLRKVVWHCYINFPKDGRHSILSNILTDRNKNTQRYSLFCLNKFWCTHKNQWVFNFYRCTGIAIRFLSWIVSKINPADRGQHIVFTAWVLQNIFETFFLLQRSFKFILYTIST